MFGAPVVDRDAPSLHGVVDFVCHKVQLVTALKDLASSRS